MLMDERITLRVTQVYYSEFHVHVLHIRHVYISILPKKTRAKLLLNRKY